MRFAFCCISWTKGACTQAKNVVGKCLTQIRLNRGRLSCNMPLTNAVKVQQQNKTKRTGVYLCGADFLTIYLIRMHIKSIFISTVFFGALVIVLLLSSHRTYGNWNFNFMRAFVHFTKVSTQTEKIV